VEVLRNRVSQNARAQEGSAAHEDAQALLDAAVRANVELHRIVLAVHEANLRGCIADGRSITAAIADRDRLSAEYAMLTAAAGAATSTAERYSSRELRWVSTLDVAAVQKRADAVSREMRELNIEIQRANWAVEVDFAG
jgi:hypothetical protein